MGFDPISISIAVAQAAAAAAKSAALQAVHVVGEDLAGGGALLAGAKGGADAAGAGAAGAKGSALTPGLEPAFTATAQESAAQAAASTAKGIAGKAAGNPLVQAATTAAATTGAQQALADPSAQKAIKPQSPAVADGAAGAAADRERRKRAPGRGASILTSPLGLSSNAQGGRRTSPGVAALTGSLG